MRSVVRPSVSAEALVSGSAAALTRIQEGSSKLGADLGLEFHFRDTARSASVGAFRAFSLRISGVDRPGIVARVSALLAAENVNVAALDSRLAFAPLSGTPMFYLSAALQVPADLGIAGLRERLARLCYDENLDLVLDADVGFA